MKHIIASIFILFVLAVIVSAVAPKSDELTANYSFEQYLQDFSEHKESLLQLDSLSLEYQKRKQIFTEELARVLKHNSEGHSWKMGINPFSDLTEEEFLQKHTGEAIIPEHAQALIQQTKEHEANELFGIKNDDSNLILQDETIPQSVDWSARGFTPKTILSQGGCGSCWAHGMKTTLEMYYKAKTGHDINLSRQQALDCFPNPRKCGGTGGCGGYTAAIAIDDYARNVGLTTEEEYPYFSGTTGKIGDCQIAGKKIVMKSRGAKRRIVNDVTDVTRALAFEGVLSMSVDAQGWKSYESGVFSQCDRGLDPETRKRVIITNHAIVAVGFGVTPQNIGYWKVVNSWGPQWGLNGHMLLRRAVNGEKENVGLNTDPAQGYKCADEDLSPYMVSGCCGSLSNNWGVLGIDVF